MEEITLFLAKVLGIYLILAGISLFTQEKIIRKSINKLADNELLVQVIASFVLAYGLIIVSFHNLWVTSWEVVVTLVGWFFLIKGAVTMVLPNEMLEKIVKTFDSRSWYLFAGVVRIVIGIFLAVKSFNAF